MANQLVLHVKVDENGNIVLKDMQNNVSRLDKNTKGLGKTLTRVFVSSAMLLALNKFRLGIAGVNKEVLEFNKLFKQIEGITNTGGKALELLKQRTLDVSNTTEHASSAIGKAVLSISKMGFTTKESLQVIPHVADLATASIVDLDEATQVAVQTMKSYGMRATDMEHITNVIQGTVSSTAIGFQDFAEAMKFVAPIAKTMNISLEETAAMIGVLGDVGIKGSIGGTTLKNMFLNILKPSDRVAQVLKGLNSEGLTFNKILKELHEQKVPIQDFLATFNKRAVAGSLALSETSERVKALTQLLKENKIQVSDVADVIRDGWILQLQMLKNTFTNVFVTIGKILDDSDLGLGIKGITQRFIELQMWLESNPEAVVSVARQIATLAKNITTLATKAFTLAIKYGSGLVKILETMVLLNIADVVGNKMTRAFANFNRSVSGASKSMSLLNPMLTAALVTLEASIYAADKYIQRIDKLQRVTSDTSMSGLENKKKALEAFSKALTEAPKEVPTVVVSGGVSVVSKRLETEAEKIKRVTGEISAAYSINPEYLESSIGHIAGWLNGLDNQIGKMKKSAEEADKERDKLADAFNLKNLLGDTDKLKEIGKRDMFAYWDAALDIQRQFSGSVKLGIRPDIAKDALQGQLGGALFPIGPTPEIPSFDSLMASSKDRAMSKTGIGGAVKPNMDLLAIKLDSLAKERDAYDKTSKYILATNQKMMDGLAQMDIDRQIQIAEAQAAQQEATKQYWTEQANGYLEATQMTVDFVTMIQDAGFEHRKAKIQQEMDLLDKRYKAEIDLVQGNDFKKQIIERKRVKERIKLEREAQKLESEQRKQQKQAALVSAAINTAVGVTQALASTAPPASFILAALVGAMGAAEIAIIASQEEFFGGGFTGYGDPKERAGTVHKREWVIPHSEVEDLGGPGGVQDMIDERIAGITHNNRNIILQVENFIGTPEYERGLFVRMQKEAQRWQI